MQIKAIIYDFVGPLLIKDKGKTVDAVIAEIDKKCGGVINENEFWEEVSKSYNIGFEDVESIKKEISLIYIKNEAMWDFHKETKGSYKTGIINNGTYSIFDIWTEKYSLDKEFDQLLNSARVGIKKPDERIFKMIAEKLRVKTGECVFIDDSGYNIEGARQSGMEGIVYSFEKHEEFLREINSLLKNGQERD